ncbi:MAG: ComEC/Rec2 family competence protein [Verrucomicrobiota bacterium]|nr:ComEC/Rec2 family competence protein [Verrucomicrobiota bacterium]
MKRPLVAVVAFYTAGLLIAQTFRPPPLVLLAALSALLVLALVLETLRVLLIGPMLVLAGASNLLLHTAILSPNDLRNLIGNGPEIVVVRGTLVRTPQIKISEREGEEIQHSLTLVRVREIRRGEKWRPAVGKIMVSTPAPLAADFFAGQAAEVSGVIARPSPPLAEGLFDYRDYLATRGIYYQLRAASTNDWRLSQPVLPKPPLTDRFLNWSRRTLAIGLPVKDDPLRLLWAMTLGWRTAFTGDIGDPFLRAGTMHLFAIDGLRIALISGMLVALLRVLRVARGWCGAVAIPVIWFYTAATGWESSAIRAAVMMTLVLGGWALKRPGDLINSLAAAAFLILLWEPRQLFEASFQLSFFVVLVIALLLPPLNRICDRALRHDPLLPDELVPRWRRTLTGALRMLSRYFALSLAAWAGSIPLSALYFHLFSPISPLANVIAVPLGTLALMSNLGALVCGAWLPGATALFNHAAWFFMVAMTWVSQVSTRIPGSFFYVPAPSWISIALYYGVLIVALSGWLNTARRKILGAAVLICIAAVYLCRWEGSRDEIQLTVLPLNGGHSVIVDATGRKNDWLVDCGDENAVNFTLKNFLRAQGVNRILRLVLTEGNLRNCGGAKSLDDLFGVGELWTSGAKFRSPAYRAAVSAFETPPSRRKIFDCGGQSGCWRALWPEATIHVPRAEDAALVLMGNFHGTRVLLLSDLGRAGQSGLISAAEDLRADIVIAGLPTGGEPLCDALLDAVRPRAVVIVDSEFPATRRASRELKERLAQRKIPVIYTRDSGAATLLVDDHGRQLRTMDGQQFTSSDRYQ